MFLIVVSHYTNIGVQPWTLGIVNPVYSSLPIGGTLGVNCFVLITGYFMINSSITFNKITRLLYQVLSVTALISLVAYCVGSPHFELSSKLFFKSAIGIWGNYWFINTYLVLVLLSPFLNKMLKSMNHDEHRLCILTLVFLNYLAHCFHIPTNFESVGLFITLYSIAAYIRIYGVSWCISLCKLSILTFILLTGGVIMIWLTQQHIIFSKLLTGLVIGHNSIYLLIISTLIFLLFTRIHIGHSRCINYLAGCTLGIYLFHEHSLMRGFLWKKVLHCDKAPFSDAPYLHCIGAILAVFCLSILADIIYRHTVGYLYNPLYRHILNPTYTTLKHKLFHLCKSKSSTK